jgi:hypothetical protein
MIYAVNLPIGALFLQAVTADTLKITDWITAVSAALALIVSVVALILAIRSQKDSSTSAEAAKRSADAAEKSLDTSVDIFKRQGVMDLFERWSNVKDIDPSNPITVDAIRATQALELTASLWNHSIIERKIILQSFWENYEHLYDRLSSITATLPKSTKSGKDLLSRRVDLAYEAMKSEDLKQEATSDIGR